MELRLLTPAIDDLSINFGLSPFISDWATAQTSFISATARELGDLLSVGPHDFRSNSSTEFGESRCTYRIFGGTSTITLSPDSLQMNFRRLNATDYAIVAEVARRSMVLLKDIGHYTRDQVSLTSNQHVHTVETHAADGYLAQFSWTQPADVAATDAELRYTPAVKVKLSDQQGEWALHRLVESSELLPGGLYVTTMIFISSPRLTPFDELRQRVERIRILANQAVGLRYPEDNSDGTHC